MCLFWVRKYGGCPPIDFFSLKPVRWLDLSSPSKPADDAIPPNSPPRGVFEADNPQLGRHPAGNLPPVTAKVANGTAGRPAIPPPPPPAVTLPPIGQPRRITPAAAVPIAGKAGVFAGSRAGLPPSPPVAGAAGPLGIAQPGNAGKKAMGGDGGRRWRDGGAGGSVASAVGKASLATGPEEDELDFRRPMRLGDFAPSWLISLVIHLVLLVMLAIFVTPAGEGIGKMLLTIGQSEQESYGELVEFEISEEPEMADPSDEMTLDSIVEIDVFSMAELPVDSPVPDLAQIDNALGREILPVMPMVGGRSGSMRQRLLAMYGGTAETEEAVELGLKWLSRQQMKDGSWSLKGPYGDGAGSENKAAATAMAMLAFLGAGHTHQSGDYQQVVDKGIRWLVKQQDRDGFFARDGRSHQQSYAQAQASIVVCELYAMTEDSWLRGPAQLALNYAERAQADRGGWRYQPREAGDTSVTGWYVMALQSGVSAGLEVDQSTFYKTREFLDSVQHDDGAAYSYQPYGAATPPMSAEGLLCRQYLGWKRDEPALVRGVARLAKDWAYNRDDPNFYYWYYATQVLHHYGGEEWKSWNGVMREHLPSMQVKSGREAGSWAPQRDRWGSSGGRLYTTCFAIYCLEVYYRHMPLYQSAGG